MFSSGPSTPTLGSALVSGGLEDRAQVHSLLQSLAATAAAAGADHLDATTAPRGRGGRRQGKRKRSSCKEEAKTSPHKRSKRQPTPTKGSQDKSPRASKKSRRQEHPQPSATPSPGSTSPPRRRRPSSATRLPVTKRGPSNRATSANKEEVEERVHQEGSDADEQQPLYHQLPPASFEMEWTEGLESPAHFETPSPSCDCGVLPPGEPHTSSRTTTGTSTSTSTSPTIEEWEELLGELYYHFGTRRDDLLQDGRGQQPARVRRRLLMDDWSSSLPLDNLPHHHHQQQLNITSQGYLLHW